MTIIVITLILIVCLLGEYLRIKVLLQPIQLRVHINGTRGKSTTTELITFLLRSANYKTLGKITGVIPTILLPDGKNRIINRYGEPRLIEQLKMITLANKLSANALVLECMSVTPEYQKCETSIFQPHIYVITNIKYDHAEQMGTNINDMADAICDSIPHNSIVVTSEDIYIHKIKETANQRNSIVISVETNDISKDLYYLYGIHPTCIALALKIGELIGLDKKNSFEQLLKNIKNRSGLIQKIQINNKNIYFVNGFSINDVPSADECLKAWKEKTGLSNNISIILNTRNDRPLRTLEFIKWLINLESIDNIILSGTHKYYAKYQLIRLHYDKSKIILLTNKILQNHIEFIKLFQKDNQLVFGVGNIKGEGFKIIQMFQKYKQ